MRHDVTYVELHCHSAFSMLDGAALPETLVARAAELGYPALVLAARGERRRGVRCAQRDSRLGIGPLSGAGITLCGQSAAGSGKTLQCASPSPLTTSHSHSHIVLLADTRDGYGNLAT